MTDLTPTTTTALRVAITNAIAACEPRIQTRAAGPWIPTERRPAGVNGTRVFTISFEPQGYTPGGIYSLGRYDCTTILQVVTSYQVPEGDSEIIEDDALQLREVILSLRDGANGIITIDYTGTVVEEQESSDAVLVAHTYALRYLRATEVD